MEELSSGEVEATVKELELKLERLRVFYEQYFLGLVKREPTVQLKECVRLIHFLDQQQIRNTAVRFRFRATLQKYNSYRSYWGRTLRAMEAGTYVRDVARVARKMAAKGISMPAPRSIRSAAQMERALLDAAAAAESESAGQAPPKATPPPAERPELPVGSPGIAPSSHPAAAEAAPPPVIDLADQAPATPNREPKAPPAAAASPYWPSEDELRSLYRRFLKAKRMCGEDTEALKYESLEKSIKRELPKLREKHGGRPIEFQVVIQKGRAILRAKPKDS